ncbi:MAG TPA: hypothetical protein VEQ40_09900, partial [Pyrinomonadaceae bacterium]|nr:hypothetical protein [Pyrinomonadaceae bacterium]
FLRLLYGPKSVRRVQEFTLAGTEKFCLRRDSNIWTKSNSLNNENALSGHQSAKIGESRQRSTICVSRRRLKFKQPPEFLPRLSTSFVPS